MACTRVLGRPILVGALVFYSPRVMPGVILLMKLERQALSIETLSSLSVAYARFDQPGRARSEIYPPPQILVVAFSGSYGYGSSGYSDALYMRAMIEAGLAAFRPSGLIIDLSDFEYEWGDDIDYGLEVSLDDTPEPTTVIGPKCHDGLKSLFRGFNSSEELIDNRNYFANLTDAVSYLAAIVIKT